MTAMSVREFNANVSRVIAMVEAGETVDITKNGKVVAELRPKRVRSTEWQQAYEETVAFLTKGLPLGIGRVDPADKYDKGMW